MSTARDMYSVDINEATQAIADVGCDVSILLEGHMGFGKTSVLYMLGEMEKFKNHTLCYFDCTTKDVGDLFIPDFFRIDGDSKCVKFIPNEEFGIHLGKPVIIMVDEIGKAFPTVKNAMNHVFLERSIGTFKLPEGSIVTNNYTIRYLHSLRKTHLSLTHSKTLITHQTIHISFTLRGQRLSVSLAEV